MKILMVFIALTVSFISYAGSGGGHGHSHSHSAPKEIKQKQAEKVGRHHIARLIKRDKIDSSWKASSLISSQKKKFFGGQEWIITFSNDKGIKGKKLFIFLRPSGEFIAANFTGK